MTSASSSSQLPDISKIDILGAQDERVYVEFSTEQLAGLGIDRAALIAALQAQNAVTPAGVVQTGDEKILVRVSGAFRSEQDVLAVNFVAQNGRIIRLGDIARVTRGPADPAAADVPRQWTRRHRARHRHAHGRRRPGPRAQRRAGDDGDHGEPAGRDRADTRRRPARDGRARGGRLHGGPVGGRRHRPRGQPGQPSACARAPWWRSRSRSSSPRCSWR